MKYFANWVLLFTTDPMLFHSCVHFTVAQYICATEHFDSASHLPEVLHM